MKGGQPGSWRHPSAELVIETGPTAGSVQPLLNPLTFVGSAASCDVLIRADGVAPLHCLIVANHASSEADESEGYSVRDLESACGTFVNGRRVFTERLESGDLLAVGSVQLRLVIVDGADPHPDVLSLPSVARLDDVARQRDALRVQAAAVAAQQIALLDEEARLAAQEAALTQHQEQLGAHLDERHQHLVEREKEIQAAEVELKRRCGEQERSLGLQKAEVLRLQVECEREGSRQLKERERLVKVARKLKVRSRRQERAAQDAIRKSQAELATARRRLAEETASLARQEHALSQERLALNGEVEVKRRQLHEEWQKLRQWQEKAAREQQEDQEFSQELRQHIACQESALTAAAQLLQDDKNTWERKRRVAVQQAEGLEQRLVHLQENLARGMAELQRVHHLAAEVMPATESLADAEVVGEVFVRRANLPLGSTLMQQVDLLRRLAEELAGHRLTLVDRWHCLLQEMEVWQRERQGTVRDLETLAAALSAREREAEQRAGDLEVWQRQLSVKQHELSEYRLHLEAWTARVVARETESAGERAALESASRQQEGAEREQARLITDLRKAWARRRQQEVGQLQETRARLERVRHECAVVLQEYCKRSLALSQQERELAEKAMALEEHRQRVVVASNDAAATESRLERMQLGWHKLNMASMRESTQSLERLRAEGETLAQTGRQIEEAGQKLAEREAELAERQAEWEERLVYAASVEAMLVQRIDGLESQLGQCQQQNAKLQGEIERLARVMLEEAEPEAAARAA
jgi:chromosome segregation ATPase